MGKKILCSITGLVSACILILTGCTTGVSTQQVSEKHDMKKYRTYAWVPSGDTTWNNISKDAKVAQEIRNEVNKELQEVGYMVNTENPDFLVLVHTKYNNGLEFQRIHENYLYYGSNFDAGIWYDNYYPSYQELRYVDGPAMSNVPYTEGTIVIDLIDRKTNEVVWRGTSNDRVYDEGAVEEMADEVDEIFASFPVADIE